MSNRTEYDPEGRPWEILSHRVPIVCDFCSSPDVTWSYPCETFIDFVVVQGNGSRDDYGSHGDWAACETCSSLIEVGNHEALLDRAIKQFLKDKLVRDPMHAVVRAGLADLHRKFVAHRKGPREPHVPRPGDGMLVREEIE